MCSQCELRAWAQAHKQILRPATSAAFFTLASLVMGTERKCWNVQRTCVLGFECMPVKQILRPAAYAAFVYARQPGGGRRAKDQTGVECPRQMPGSGSGGAGVAATNRALSCACQSPHRGILSAGFALLLPLQAISISMPTDAPADLLGREMRDMRSMAFSAPVQVGGELRGNDATLAVVRRHAFDNGLLYRRFADGAPGRQHVGAVAHEQRHALPPCSKQGK